MKLRHDILAVALALAFAITIAPVFAIAAEREVGDSAGSLDNGNDDQNSIVARLLASGAPDSSFGLAPRTASIPTPPGR